MHRRWGGRGKQKNVQSRYSAFLVGARCTRPHSPWMQRRHAVLLPRTKGRKAHLCVFGARWVGSAPREQFARFAFAASQYF